MSESPENGESGRGAGVEFHSVTGESCCAGVQVFYFTGALIYVYPSTWPPCEPTARLGKAFMENPTSTVSVPHTTC